MHTNAVAIEVEAVNAVNLAMAHNRIRVISRVTIKNRTEHDITGILRITITDAQGPLATPWERRLELPVGTTHETKDVDIALDTAAMDQVDVMRPGRIVVEFRHAAAASGDTAGDATQHATTAGDATGARDATQNATTQHITRTGVDIDVLPANYWVRSPQRLSYELLSAMVMPNAPEIEALLADASAILRQNTGSSSIEGYQSGPERADQIAWAIFEALKARNLHYVEPPANWGIVGQIVRTPNDVLTNRAGTCLDTTTVLAAAFEQAGLRPLIWITHGHAFLGYWRYEMAMWDVAQTDIHEIINRVDMNHIGLLETTLVNNPDNTVTARQVHDAAYDRWLKGEASEVLAVVDVWMARRHQIIPIPAVKRTADTVQVVEYRPALHSVPPIDRVDAATGAEQTGPDAPAPRAQAPARVQQWKNALLDLSLRNQLINFRPKRAIELQLPGEGVHTIENWLNASRTITLLAHDDINPIHQARHDTHNAKDLPAEVLKEVFDTRRSVYTDLSSGRYLTALRNLANRARTIIEETGSNNLYLALGTLYWDFEGKPLQSPLILLPVFLRPANKRATAYQISLDESGGSTPNFSLLEKLERTFGLRVPGMLNPATDESGIDIQAAFHSLREELVKAGLNFRVDTSAHLAILQFAKFRLWKDLDDHWDELLKAPLVNHLALNPLEHFADPACETPTTNLDELAAQCPISADASQLRAIADALAGKTFVLEGPPGTGKSQTITNLLAVAVAAGKKVLFVAEKAAALDVVKRRLDDVGLARLTLNLHDKSAKPAVVREHLLNSLDDTGRGEFNDWETRLADLAGTVHTLAAYTDVLHEPNAAGHSLYGAVAQSAHITSDSPALPVPQSLLGPGKDDDVAQLRAVMRDYVVTAIPAKPSRSTPWGFTTADEVAALDIARIQDAASAFDAVVGKARQVRSWGLGTEAGGSDVTGGQPGGSLGAALREVTEPTQFAQILYAVTEPGLSATLLDEVAGENWETSADHVLGLLDQVGVYVQGAAGHILQRFPIGIIDKPLPDINDAFVRAQDSNWFGRKGRVRTATGRLAALQYTPSDISADEMGAIMQVLLPLQQLVFNLRYQMSRMAGLYDPRGFNPLDGNQAGQLRWRIFVLRSLARAANSRGTGSGVTGARATGARPTGDRATGNRTTGDFASQLRELADTGYRTYGSHMPPADLQILRDLAGASAELMRVLPSDKDSWNSWCADLNTGILAAWQRTAPARRVGDTQLTSLRQWVTLREHLAPLATNGLFDAHEMLLNGEVNPEDAVMSFELGLVETSIEERLIATGLVDFNGEVHNRHISRFHARSAELRKMLVEAIPASAINRRGFASNARNGEIGRFRRELVKQRRAMSVRELMANFLPLITELTPLVLVSPDSLARFIPVQNGIFDLVVFDEASQIRVADAIGAIGRGKATVVVGDSKQMPPTAFMEPVFDDAGEADEDDIVVADEESILSECVQAAVDRHWLSWHYRSKSESLIAFSNAMYYGGKLTTFPAPNAARADAGSDGYGVSLVRVDGHFQRSGKGKYLRTNREEAEAIVAEIQRRFADSPERVPSIGVVTFNVQQRNLIESMLLDTEDERIIAALETREEEGLFVKNLENVQGDERDAIFFSTAFSVNDKGVLPLNFGPLNLAGGERRLNVAITRARRQVVIFSSFDPAQLRAEETSSVGIKHLRAYLDIAAGNEAQRQAALERSDISDYHRDEIARGLRERGLNVTCDVGLSSFRVDIQVNETTPPHRPLLAVLLDGPQWARRETVGDRDGIPATVLRNAMGWPAVERIWLPTWLTDSQAVLDRIVRMVERLEAGEDVDDAAGLDGAEALDHTQPLDHTSASDHTQPLGSAPGLDPAQALDHTQPLDPTSASDHTQPLDHTSALDPTQPLDPAQPLDHVPGNGVVHGETSENIAPVELVIPAVGPVEVTVHPPGSEIPEGTNEPGLATGFTTTFVRPNESTRVDSEAEDVRISQFVPWQIEVIGRSSELDASRGSRKAQRVTQLAEKIIEQEGPIDGDRLIKMVASSFDLNRVSTERKKTIARLFNMPPDEFGFYWASGARPGEWLDSREDLERQRPIAEVHPIEIANMMRWHCLQAMAFDSKEELFRVTMNSFGINRLTAATTQYLDKAFEVGLAKKRINFVDGYIVAAEREAAE
ncbi:MAG: DUF4011 domain-containing protein [Arcanobacterium sp.]